MSLIEICELTKRFWISRKSPGLIRAAKHLFRPHYDEKIAVDHIDLKIEAGESVAYVGPNGAGKSTTIKMLTGIIVPTSGTLHVAGLVPYRQRIENARNIGVVFGQRTQLWWDLPVQESLRLIGDIYEIPQECGIHGLGSVVLGSIILTTAIHKLNLSWSWWQYGFLFITLISSVLLIGSIDYATNCIAFWDSSANSAFPFLVQYGIEFAKYPMTLYSRFIQIVVTWILPFAFMSYYPSLILLEKTESQVWLGYLSPLAGPIMALIASIVWRRGLLRYQGSGH